MTSANQPLLLSYRGSLREAEPPLPPRPLWPILSVVPGLVSWLFFASAAMPREIPILERLTMLIGGWGVTLAVLVLWGSAVVSSIAALIVYSRRPQVWYSTLCIAFHLVGLSFSALLIGGIAILRLT